MTISAALKSHLQAASAISTLVGDRIYPVIRPERAELPAIVYQLISLDDNGSLGGSSAGAAGGLDRYRVQMDCWGRSFSDVESLADAVRVRMAVAASSFRSTLLESGFDDYEPDTKLYRVQLEFSCWYSPS